ncbi:TetR/AcrR family transcriptional regulator [Maricaulis sp.]|uniref:TetR/AcrR family transcriptional regulator n=1 Tax=Maricaulis sp. TaxID=1486257 RepID=UPI002B26F6C7|nr:TetR/AcrR family transcriptional regulator [Maricaulis sp.]
MGRPSSFLDDTVFAAVANCLVEQGEVRLQAVTATAGVSTGSIYHRFGSREGLMAAAWLDAVEAFQERFLVALAAGTREAGLAAALATPAFCREEVARALILTMGRRAEMMSDKAPAEMRARLDQINGQGKAGLERFAFEQRLPLQRVRLALIGVPLGAVRLYLPDKAVPEGVDDDIRLAVSALLAAR